MVISSKGNNYPRTYWYGENQGVNCSVNSAGSTQTFLPKTTFDYTVGEKPDYLVQASTESLDFGTCGVNTTTTLNVTLKNKGANAVTPTVSGLSAPFSTTYASAELASGASVTIPVTFNPTQEGEYIGTMTVNCGDAGTLSVALSGTSELALILCDGSTGTLQSNEGIPIYGYYYDTQGTKTRFIYPASKLTALVGKQITSVTFYSTNDRASLNGGELSFYAGETDATAALSATVDDLTEVWKGPMSPGGNELTFVFDSPMTYSGGNLAFGSNVNIKGTYERLNWYGEKMDYASACYRNTNAQFLPKVKIAYAEPSDYAMTVAPEALDFGTVIVGGNKTFNVKVTNSGAQAFTPAVSGLEAPFSTNFTPAELAAAANVMVPVTFAPTAGGEFTATLTIDGGEAGTKTVTITGTGLAVPTGYQETFDGITAEAKIPAGWKAVKVSGTTLTNVTAGNYTESDYGFDVMDLDGGGKAIAFDKSSSREDYVYYLYYLISPEIKGDVFITAKHTQYQYTSNRFRVFNVDADGTILASTGSEGSEVTVNWIPAMSADEWSYGTFNMPESGRVAILMGYAEMDFFAADEVVMAPSVRVDGLAEVPTDVTASAEGTAHFAFEATVTNNGLTDVAAGDYNLLVYNAADMENVIATIPGNALAQGATANQTIEFDYAPANLQPTQQVRFVVAEDMNATYAMTDNITLRALVPIAALYKADGTTALPAKTDVGVFRGSRDMTFVLANNGTAPLTYEITPAEGVTIEPLSGTIAADQQVSVTATFATPGVIDGTVASIATNAGTLTVDASAACLAESTFLEDFEDELDASWMVGSSYQFSDRNSSTFGNADDTYNKKLAYVSINNYNDSKLISPAVEFNAETGLDLHLTTFGVAFGPSVAVSYSTNRVDWTAFEGVTTNRNEFVNNTLTLPAEDTYYFMFDVYGAAIDDIFGGTLASLPHDAMIADFAGPAKGMVNKTATYTASLRNMKPEADSFTVTLTEDGEVVDFEEVSNLDGETTLSFIYTPHTAGTHTLQVVARADDYSVYSSSLAVEVAEESAVESIVVNNGTATKDYMPFYGLKYYHSGGKYLYTAADIAGKMKAGDKIVKVGFLYKTNQYEYQMPNIRIWAGNSEKTTFTDAKEVPISLEGLSQVFDCGQPDEGYDFTKDGELTFTFTEPVVYDGNTFEIVVCDDNDIYKYNPIVFYGTDVTGRVQSEYWYHDQSTTPVGEEKINSLTDAQLSTSTFLPSIVFYVESEPATVSGTVTDGDTPIEGAQLSFTQEGKLYEATTDAEGHYSVDIIQPGEGYTLTVTAEGYDTYTETRDITESMTWNVNLGGEEPETIVLAGVQFTADNKYATWYGDQDLAAPAGVTIYAVASITDDVAVIEPLTYIPANKGVLLYSETPAQEVQAAVYQGTTEQVESMLVGSLEGMTIGEGYVLYNDCFIFTNGGQLAAHRCYLPKAEAPAGAPARLRLAVADDMIVTAISDITNGKAIDKVTYVNAAGQQSDHSYSGINIVVTRYTDGSVSTTKMVVK